MRYCPSCRIDFTGVLDRCPLCGSKLEGTPEGMIFPENEFARTKKLAKRSMIALTFAALAFVRSSRAHACISRNRVCSFAAVIREHTSSSATWSCTPLAFFVSSSATSSW